MGSFRSLVETVLLHEGVYDPSIFKAVFLSGGSGAGKGYVSTHTGLAMGSYGGTDYGAGQDDSFLTYEDVLGREVRQAVATTSALGLKVLNSDDFSNWFNLRKENNPISLGTMNSSGGIYVNYDQLQADTRVYPELSTEEYPDGGTKYDKSQANWAKAQSSFKNRFSMWSEMGLGLLIDQTSSDYGKVWKMKADLEDLGYDCAMVNVIMPRALAWEQNVSRGLRGKQVLPQEVFDAVWDNIESLGSAYANLFGDNYFEVVNRGRGYALEGANEVYNAIRAFCATPPSNPDVRAWIEWMKSSD